MIKSQTKYILGTKIDDVSIDQALNFTKDILDSNAKKSYIVTPNPEICLHSIGDKAYGKIINDAFLSLPDGIGLKLAAMIFSEPLLHRVTGIDFTMALMRLAQEKGWRVFLFGGEKSVAATCAQILKKRYRGLRIAGAYDGGQISRPISSSNDQVIKMINEARPDILLVALGAPKQEKWIARYLPKLQTVRLSVGVGGTFDFIAGRVRRAPQVMQTFGLEWLWRLFIQPWRVGRIYNATIKFLYTVIKWRLRMWFVYRPNVVGLIMKDGKILLVERNDESDHWQLPQGGIDAGEDASDAFFREMKEELGIDALLVRVHIPRYFRYRWPKVNQLMQGYRGQVQDLFVAEFRGYDKDICIDSDELAAYRFVSHKEAVKIAHPVRKEQITRALSFIPQH